MFNHWQRQAKFQGQLQELENLKHILNKVFEGGLMKHILFNQYKAAGAELSSDSQSAFWCKLWGLLCKAFPTPLHFKDVETNNIVFSENDN